MPPPPLPPFLSLTQLSSCLLHNVPFLLSAGLTLSFLILLLLVFMEVNNSTLMCIERTYGRVNVLFVRI